MPRACGLVSLLLLAAGQLPAQPQGIVHWSAEGNDGIYNAIAAGDANGDSLPDVAASIYYGATPSDPRKLYCCSGATGDTIWVNRTTYGTWGNKGLDVSADLNRDGFADLLLGTAGGYTTAGRSVIAVSGLTGDTLWRYTRYQYWGWVYSVRSFVDIDGDSVPDVLGGSGNATDSAGAVVLVSGRTGRAIWLRRMFDDGVGSVAPFGDINRDSQPDVLVGVGGNSNSDSVLCLSGADGATIWRTATGGSVSDIERIRDVNRSGTDDVIAGGWDYSVYCLEGSTGSVIWSTPMGTARIVMEIVPIRDVNADGVDDVVVGSWSTMVTVLSGRDGSTLWNGALASDVWAVDTLADVTGDGIPEVVAGCLGNGTGLVKVFSGASGEALWQYSFSERVYDVTGAPDLNGDERPDVLVGLQNQGHEANHLICFDGAPPAAAAGNGAARSRPTMLRYDAARAELLVQAAPGARYRLTVADLCGRQVGLTASGTGPIPRWHAVPGLGAGVYFARLDLDHREQTTLKFVVP